MANLRTNNLSGEGGRNAYDGSVFFDGAHSYLTLASGEVISGTGFGTGDFTVEFWINQQGNSGNYMGLVTLTSTTAAKRFEVSFHSGTIQVYTDTGAWRDTGYTPVSGVYEHIVFQRDYSGNTLKMYANGVEQWSVSNNRDYDEPFTTKIGIHNTGYNSLRGYLSNLRICIGHLVYSSNNFTPPTSPLTVHYTADDDKTVLLCCQDSDNPLQEATGKTITGYGRNADSSVELVPNGGPTTDITGWEGYQSSVAYDSGQIKVTRSGGVGFTAYIQITNAVVGQRYVLSGQVRSASSRCDLYVTTAVASGTLIQIVGPTGATADLSGEFTATATTLYVFTAIDGDGDIGYFNRISVKAADKGGAPKVLPPFGTDAGNTFNGAITMNSTSWMYFPTGRTEERARGRAVFMGGSQTPFTPKIMDTIDYVEMTTSGVGVRFGSLTTTNCQSAAFASSTRGINAGGQTSAPGDNQTNIIEFVTIATEGNGTDFGNLDTVHRRLGGSGHSSQTRGIITGGSGDSPGETNVIQYVTIASLGDATNFGDLLNPKDNMMSKNGSSTRMLICGGRDYTPSATVTNVIEFLTIATTGNSADFGDLTQARYAGTGCGSATRGIIAGGQTPTYVNTIDYVTIASTGDATDFGDLTATLSFLGGASNSIIGIFAGGATPTKQSSISSIEIATTGNAVAFGDNTATNPVTSRGTCSDSHGGLS